MIQLNNLVKDYGKHRAVNQLELAIPAGTVFAFLGPNGAGKTTTIKMMVGLLLPTAGQIRLSGFDVVDQPREAKGSVGYVPDQPELYDKLTGREFLQFVAQMYGLDANEVDAQIERLAEIFELTEYFDRLSEGYSHGMKQRVAFAAALIHRPHVLILDEPMVGLDPKTMRTVKNLMREEAAGGRTVFMSTHSLHIAEEVADQIGVIDNGRLLFLGTLEELRETMRRSPQAGSATTDPDALDSATQTAGAVAGQPPAAVDNLEDLFLQLTGGERTP